jgi:hypothetical protein
MATSPERIVDLTGTDFKLVAQPTMFQFTRDIETNEADVRIQWQQALTVDGVANRIDIGTSGVVHRGWNVAKDIQPAYPGATDPITGADLTQISFRGILSLLNDAFDRLYVIDNPIVP